MNYSTATVSQSRPKVNSATGGLISASEMRKRKAKKEKMKISFRQRIRNWLYADQDVDMPEAVIARDDDDDLRIDHDMALHFSVIPAAGGKIVRVQYYDRVKDRNINKLSIITPDENLADSLAQILQIEVLSR